MAFDPNSPYTSFVDADGTLLLMQNSVVYDSSGNSYSSIPKSRSRGVSPGLALTAGDVLAPRSVAAPYRLLSYGDSRCFTASSGTQIGRAGSGQVYTSQRVPTMLAAMLGDTELVADFGVSGDTLISSSSTTGWNGVSRSNSKTIANAIALRPDIVYIQYGINDLPSASSASLISAAQSLVSQFIAAGIKVCLSNIMLFDPTASSANISPANAVATLAKINAFRDAMSAWCANLTGRVVFVDPNPLIALASTGYGDPSYFFASDNLGVHPNRRGAQVMAAQAAIAVRSLIPAKNAKCYTMGPQSNPNLVDWGAAASTNLFAVNSLQGTTTATSPTWNVDSVTGEVYAETTFTVTALNGSGVSQAMFKVEATDVSGATPKLPINVGDVIQGSARVTVDDGSGGAPAGLQDVSARVRMFNTVGASQFFVDWNGVAGSVLQSLPLPVNVRMFTPVCATPIASVNIDTPQAGSGRGFYYGVFIEANALGTYRVRMYYPSLRVVSIPQPTNVTAGASPYIWQNNPQPFVANDWVNSIGRDVQVAVGPGAGGTISQIEIIRGPLVSGAPLNAISTNLTQGVFILKPGDALRVTWATTAAVLTVIPL